VLPVGWSSSSSGVLRLLGWAGLAASLWACGAPERARQSGARAVESAGAAAVTAVTAGDDAPPHGEYEVPRPGAWALRVTVQWTGATGTTHYADRVVVRGRNGAERVWQTPEDAFALGRPLVPLIEEQRRLDDRHVLLLGWSSTGGGMQSYHAITLDSDTAQPSRTVVWTGDRGSAARGVRIAGTRLGFPVPHSPESELRVDADRHDLDGLARLEEAVAPADAAWFAAPFAPDTSAGGDALVWIDLAQATAKP
jgi:hypothetical protein